MLASSAGLHYQSTVELTGVGMSQNHQSDIIRQLFNKGLPIAAAKGETILGDDGDGVEPNGVYFISSGYVKVYTIGNDGSERVRYIHGAGEVFPITWAYLDSKPDGCYFSALSDCVVWRLARDWFTHFVRNRADIGYAMSLQLARQYNTASERIDNLEYKRAGERVVYRLVALAQRFGIKTDEGIAIEPVLTHEVFAGTVNLARESVSREIEKLVRLDIVRYIDHHLVITNVQRLIAVLNSPDYDRMRRIFAEASFVG